MAHATKNIQPAVAENLGVDLLIGSIAEQHIVDERCYNTSLPLTKMGKRIAHYRKIHLFDVDLSVRVGLFLQESAIFTEAGTDLVCADGQVMSRFEHLL